MTGVWRTLKTKHSSITVKLPLTDTPVPPKEPLLHHMPWSLSESTSVRNGGVSQRQRVKGRRAEILQTVSFGTLDAEKSLEQAGAPMTKLSPQFDRSTVQVLKETLLLLPTCMASCTATSPMRTIISTSALAQGALSTPSERVA